MITPTHSKILAALTATALIVGGCGGSNESNSAETSSPSAPTSAGVPQMSDQQAPPTRLVVKVSIAGGKVTPTDAQFKSSVGDPIIFQIDSDVADRLNVHSDPEHTFTIEPRSGQSFLFTAAVPGKVDVQLQQLNRTIATIQVQ